MIKPTDILFNDWSARALVEAVEKLVDRVNALESQLREAHSSARRAADEAADCSVRLCELRDDLEKAEVI